MRSVIALSSEDATLDSVGGKGWNLSRLSRAGFPVPPGFLITTEAYQLFVSRHYLQSRIASIARGVIPTDPRSMDAASTEIRDLFEAGDMPGEVAEAIRFAYRSLAGPEVPADGQGEKPASLPVAVRSSATAEDLPGLSFAGQQDTFLNVIGEPELLGAVKKCWASLWTARAIGYRARNQISPDGVELAVVVQQMVAAESSGVLFTANPLTGRRDEIVIDASFGLGEAVVSGQVDPDHYVVRPGERAIVSRKLGAKAQVIVPVAGGGTKAIGGDAGDRQALPDEQILELSAMATRVAAAFGGPQDVEWAWADGRLHLLQARPITSLYPLPDVPADLGRTRVYLSLNSFQGVTDPFTPLGSDVLQIVLGGFLRLFGVQREARKLIPKAGMRLFLDVTDLVEDPRLRRALMVVLSRGDPVAKAVLDALSSEGRLHSAPILQRSQLIRLLAFVVPTLARAVATMAAPGRMRRWAFGAAERALARARLSADEASTLPALLATMEMDLGHGIRVVVPHFVPQIAASMVLLSLVGGLLTRWAQASPGAVLELVRGLEGNVTTEMDLRLWDVARSVRADPLEARAIEALPPNALAQRFGRGELPAALEAGVHGFLERYGMRTAAEIDLGRARWREDPTQVLGALQGYIGLSDQRLAPDAVFLNGARRSKELAAGYVAAARTGSLGAVKAALLGGAISRMRALLSIREAPKLCMVKLLDVYRQALLRQGDGLVAQGRLGQADDIFFLPLETVRTIVPGEASDLKSLVGASRGEWEVERRRRQIPRVMLSDGETFYGFPKDGVEGDLRGEPVSPGVAEGKVRVILDPRGAALEPGEILVCPATDPGWTLLFLTAGALVMEMGGLVTHGAVVAREYGIPAVVGVHEATTRLETGERVRVDGTSGIVTRLG